MSRRTMIIGGVILVLVVGVGALVWSRQQQSAASTAAQRQTGTLSRGELVASVSGAGNIYAPQQADLSFGVSGVPVTRVNVKVGDKVKAGDVLAEVESAELEEALKTAELNLANAQAVLDDLIAPPTSDELEIAEAKVRAAQAAYDAARASLADLQAPPDALELQAAQAQLASAQMNYDAALAESRLRDQQILVDRAAVERARVALEAAQQAYNAIAWRDDAPNSAAAQTLQTATIDYETAKANFELTMTGRNDSALRSAEAALAQARTNLENLTRGATEQELANAQAAVDQALQTLTQAKSDLQALKDGPTQQQLLAAQASVQSARASRLAAQKNLENAKIIAPFDGTVAQVNIAVGQTASAGTTAIVLANLGDLQIELALSEVDIAQVKPGQTVELTIDALGGRSFPGKVLSVSPVGTTTQGVVNYTVTVGLEDADPAILPGMTAAAAIETARRDNVLRAPNRALRTQGNRRILTLLFEGREIPVLVQTGLVNDQYTEIVSASLPNGEAVQLQEGDTVILNTTSSTTTLGGFGPGGGVFAPAGGIPIR